MSRQRRTWRLALATLALTCSSTSEPRADTLPFDALRARLAILDLRLDDAAKILSDGDDSADVAVERARLALYRGHCDAAVAIAQRSDVARTEEGNTLLMVAQGCARASAATIVISNEQHGVVVRLQNDRDRALAPLIARAVSQTRTTLQNDLGVKLPSPVFVDLLRDQLSLAAMSGLPETAAQTTGTVAVAKWGRVMMLSPRSSPRGYPWLDTLAHEMTHLALSQATRDRAPLWLQEGVAKREEVRWRYPGPFDHRPSADVLAARGIQRHLDLPLTKRGPSIAMLPTAEQAAVAFAQVTSFVDYWANHAGDRALPQLLTAVRDSAELRENATSVALEKVSGRKMTDWEARWRAHIATLPPGALAQRAVPPLKALRESSRRERLGRLLFDRGHTRAAIKQLTRAHELRPRRAALRAVYARALLAAGQVLEATDLVADANAVGAANASWWSLHARLGGTEVQARQRALAIHPLKEAIACEELPVDELPSDPDARSLCLTASENTTPSLPAP